MYLKTKSLFILYLLVFFMLTFYSCKKTTAINEPSGRLAGITGCITGSVNSVSSSEENGGIQECIRYQYNSQGLLTIMHTNALFNCCPGKIDAEIDLGADTIVIREIEQEAGCYCNCHYDVKYEITEITPGIYTLQILCVDGRTLYLTIDFTITQEGNRCWESPLKNYAPGN